MEEFLVLSIILAFVNVGGWFFLTVPISVNVRGEYPKFPVWFKVIICLIASVVFIYGALHGR